MTQTVSPIGLTRPVLAQAMDEVGSVAGDCGLMLALTFGGSVPFTCDEPDSDSEDAV